MEQTESSNETKPIIDATPSKSPEGEKEENIINPAIVIKKHLTEIYQRLSQLEAKIGKHLDVTNQKIDTIDRTKLSTQEFRQFVDTLNKTLIEALQTVATADSSASVTPLKNENTQGGTTTAQNTEHAHATATSLPSPPRPPPLVKTTSIPPPPRPPILVSKNHRLSFPLKTNGEIFYVGNGVTAVIGDAVIPSGAKVDEALVVKGTLRTGEACRLLKDVKALQNIAIGRNSIVEGNLVSGGKIILGLNCRVKGTIQGEIQGVERNTPSRAI